MTGGVTPDGERPWVFRHPVTRCRVCDRPNDALTHSSLKQVAPSDGDVTACFFCGEVSIIVFGPLGYHLREATTAELVKIRRDHGRLLRALAAERGRRGQA